MLRDARTVLIANDDPVSQGILAAGVEKARCAPVLASNGREAWETLQHNPEVTLLIADMVMPEMTGEIVFRRLRADEHFKSLPISLVSARVSRATVEDLLKRGPARFVAKPLSVRVVAAEISALLKECTLATID